MERYYDQRLLKRESLGREGPYSQFGHKGGLICPWVVHAAPLETQKHFLHSSQHKDLCWSWPFSQRTRDGFDIADRNHFQTLQVVQFVRRTSGRARSIRKEVMYRDNGKENGNHYIIIGYILGL